MYKIRIPYSDSIIKIAFFLFISFTFFPKGVPFQPKLQEQGLEEIGESNIINQIINIVIFILSLIAAIPKLDEIISFIKKEKFLFILISWSLISIFWSDFPLVTFKRWFQIFLIYFLIITYFSYYPISQAVRLIKTIIYPYIIITIFSCLLIQGALDPDFGSWRGLTPHKNTLGQFGVILSVLTLIIVSMETGRMKKIFSITFFFLSVVIVLGTFSSTSYIALFIFLTGTLLYWTKTKIFGRMGVHNSLFIYTFTTGIVILIIVMIFVPEFTDFIQGIFGKSETFYDRGKLWLAMLWQASQHPILGCGFQAFWTIENPQLLLLYQTFIWLPNQAHNGYIDLINEIGIVGLILFILMIVKNIVRSFRYQILTPWLWFLILPLISNVTESNFFRVGPVTPTFIILSYLVLEKSLNNFRKEVL